VTITPNPPVAGKTLTIAGAGIFKSAVTSGQIVLDVSYGGYPLLNTTLDLCSTIAKFKPCPIGTGPQTITVSLDIPSTVPAGDYSAKVTILNQANARVTCVQGKATF